MIAFYYYRGKLIPVNGEHPEPIDRVYRGYVRLRFHDDLETLSAQGRSMNLVRRAVAAYLDQAGPGEIPVTVAQQWPGHYSEVDVTKF